MDINALISKQLFSHLVSEWNTHIVDPYYPSDELAQNICQSFFDPTFTRLHQFQIQSLGSLTEYAVVFQQALKRHPIKGVQSLIEVVRGQDRALDQICQHWMGQDWSVIGPVMGILITHQYETLMSQLLHHIKHCNHLTLPQEYHHQWMASVLYSSIRLQKQNMFDQVLVHLLNNFEPTHNELSVFAPALRESARHLNKHAAQQTITHVSDVKSFVHDSQNHYKLFYEHHVDWLLQFVDDQTWQDVMNEHPSLLYQQHSAQRQNDIIFAAINKDDQQGRGKKRM